MSKPQFLQADNLDDRREIATLLARLPPAQRVAWLDRQCRRSVLGRSKTRPGVSRKTRELAELARIDDSADERLSVEIYLDGWTLAAQYNLDLDVALADLVAMVRRREMP